MRPEATTREERIRQRSAERRSVQRAERRRSILDAAATLFLEHGYERFSLRQVAEEIGYSPTTIYLYFSDKDDLLFHVAMDGFGRFGEELQEACDGASEPLEKLAAIGEAYVEFGLTNPVHYRLMFMQRGEFLEREPPEGYESVIDSFGILTRTVEECLEAGVIEDGDTLAYAAMIWAAVHGVVALAIATPYLEYERALAVHRLTARSLIHGIRS
ncbi:MAG TPA: TetR/AcrR family transcriptional regulator [Trueperaceae bacterium]